MMTKFKFLELLVVVGAFVHVAVPLRIRFRIRCSPLMMKTAVAIR